MRNLANDQGRRTQLRGLLPTALDAPGNVLMSRGAREENALPEAATAKEISDGIEAIARYIDSVEGKLQQIRCVTLELVLGCCGLVVPTEFVSKLANLLQKKGVYFYVDECLTYGRARGMLMCRSPGVNLRPDCIIGGKVR